MSGDRQNGAALKQLREMILLGEFASGERVTEAALAERLGISRTPIRHALPALAQEGLLVASGARGFAVRGFTPHECLEALRLRAALEGLAARAVAEAGAGAVLLERFESCLVEGDAIFAKGCVIETDEALYGAMNQTFHTLLLKGAGNALLSDMVARCNLVPFVSPATIAFDRSDLATVYAFLSYAQRQHHAIVDAIRTRNPARAEFLLREHAITQEQSMNFANQPARIAPEGAARRKAASSPARTA